MAISLAHDVLAYFNDRGSAVCTCSIDAIPHAGIFGKLDGIVPDYDYVCVVSVNACHHKATRSTRAEIACQEMNPPGGLSSPWIFNLFYRDLIYTISKSDRGISLRGKTYSVFCYADDLPIASTTSTGLEALIDLCGSYIYPSTECGSTLRQQAAPL